MANYITAEQFVSAFKKAWDAALKSKSEEEIKSIFMNNTKTTEFMIGNKSAIAEDRKDCLIHEAKKLIDEKDSFNIWHELYSLDSVICSSDNLLEYGDYPSEIHVCIEHENGNCIEEEFWKLLHWRCPLKVIIFYDYNEDEKLRSPKKRAFLRVKIENMTNMYEKVQAYFAENEVTTYLFIVGNRQKSEGMMEWRFGSLCNSKSTPLQFRLIYEERI